MAEHDASGLLTGRARRPRSGSRPAFVLALLFFALGAEAEPRGEAEAQRLGSGFSFAGFPLNITGITRQVLPDLILGIGILSVLQVKHDPYIAALFTGTLVQGDAIGFGITANVTPMGDGGALELFASAELAPRPGETAADMVYGIDGWYGRDPTPVDGSPDLDLASATPVGLPGLAFSAPGTSSEAVGPLAFSATESSEAIDVMRLSGTIEAEPPFGAGGVFEAFGFFCMAPTDGAACPDPLMIRDDLRAEASKTVVPLPGTALLLLSAVVPLGLAAVRRAGGTAGQATPRM